MSLCCILACIYPTTKNITSPSSYKNYFNPNFVKIEDINCHNELQFEDVANVEKMNDISMWVFESHEKDVNEFSPEF